LVPFARFVFTYPESLSTYISAKEAPIRTGPFIPFFLFSPAAQTPYAASSIAT